MLIPLAVANVVALKTPPPIAIITTSTQPSPATLAVIPIYFVSVLLLVIRTTNARNFICPSLKTAEYSQFNLQNAR